MKDRKLQTIAGTVALVLLLSVLLPTSAAAVVWSDNFTDEVLDGWTIFGYENATYGNLIDGNFTAVGGMLTSLDDDFNWARHNSTTNVGTWNYDMYVPDVAGAVIGVSFMSNGSRPFPRYETRSISVDAMHDQSQFTFWQIRGDEAMGLDMPHPMPEGIVGWHHINITRTSGGHFYISINDTLAWDFVSNDVTTSTYLEAWALNGTGAMFDNFVVTDTPIIPTTTTTTTTTSTNETPLPLGLIAAGVGILLVLVIVVYWYKR
jgi:hypothetical protein